jgi:hypothetical protein
VSGGIAVKCALTFRSLSLSLCVPPPPQERKKYKKTEADLLKRYNIAFAKDIIKQSAAMVTAESAKGDDGYNSNDERARLISRYPAAAIPAPLPIIPTSSAHHHGGSLPVPFPYGSLGSLLPPSMYGVGVGGGPGLDFSNFPGGGGLAAAAAAATPLVSANFEPTFLAHLGDISSSLKRIANVLEGSRAVAQAVRGAAGDAMDLDVDAAASSSNGGKKRKKEDQQQHQQQHDQEEETSSPENSPNKRRMMNEGDHEAKYHNTEATATKKK